MLESFIVWLLGERITLVVCVGIGLGSCIAMARAACRFLDRHGAIKAQASTRRIREH
jgi:hypothetical protein